MVTLIDEIGDEYVAGQFDTISFTLKRREDEYILDEDFRELFEVKGGLTEIQVRLEENGFGFRFV